MFAVKKFGGVQFGIAGKIGRGGQFGDGAEADFLQLRQAGDEGEVVGLAAGGEFEALKVRIDVGQFFGADEFVADVQRDRAFVARQAAQIQFAQSDAVQFGVVQQRIVFHGQDAVIQRQAFQTGNYEQAFRLWQPLAEKGDARAQNNLGVMYEKGRGVAQDYQQAIAWWQKAANQEDAKAQFNLGVMYEKGWGVKQNDQQAVAWYQKAANQGFAMAQYNLGLMYANGRGVAQDYQQAKAWWQKALAQPDTKADAEAKALARENLQKLRKMGIR